MEKKESLGVIHEKEHILTVLKNVKKALIEKEYIKIKNLSNQIIHHASIHQDSEIISVAVIIYTLSKILERESYQKEANWNELYSDYVNCINNAIQNLENNDMEKFHSDLEALRKSIQNLSGNLKTYVNDVFRKASINKASRVYEHGISMEKTAKILGISLWELSEYAGKTGIADVNLAVTMPVKQRIKIAEEMFRK
jgi:hypothetical protein